MTTHSDIEAFFERNAGKRIALAFSSGKDSAAVLKLLRPWQSQFDVIWCNQGNPYPETLAYMEGIAKTVPRFLVVLGNQPADIAANGWPVDVLPAQGTAIFQEISRKPAVRLRMFQECCTANFWMPLAKFLTHRDYSVVIRGDKNADKLRSSLAPTPLLPGIEFFCPLWDWTDGQVMEFLGDDLPASYRRGLRSSLDCINCTAYTSENANRIADLFHVDKAAWEQVSVVHLEVLKMVEENLQHIKACHGD